MKKVQFHYPNPIHFDVDTMRDVEVYIDRIPRSIVEPNKIRIIILEEPRKGQVYRQVQHHPSWYSYVLTFHDELLRKEPRLQGKARRFLMMNTWVKDYVPKKKEFSVSTVVGGKSSPRVPGYEIRHELWRNRQSITIPRKFYLSGNAVNSHTFIPWTEVSYEGELVLGDSKKPLFDSMFHIAIESFQIKNYFSEKILDCFQTKTIPVYCGCGNIGEFFNIKGILVCNTIKEIIDTCNGLTPEYYKRSKDAIEDNYNRAMKWLDPKQQVEDAVREILKEVR